MKKESLSLGLDLGGTKVYAVVTGPDLKILADAKSDTITGESPELIARQLQETGLKALGKINVSLDSVKNIGVAVPSSVDPATGDCLHAPNLGLKNFSLKKYFRELFGREVYLANDGNCGILSEFHLGAARGFNSAVGYFVGTGLGGGIIINGKLLLGNRGLAAELGHQIIVYEGRRCGCGNRGCVEAYCSKAGFVRALKEELGGKRGQESFLADKLDKHGKNVKSRHLAAAYKAGDKTAVRILEDGFKILGAAAASVTAVVAPECIVLGGGVMEAMGEELFPVFEKSYRKNLFGISPDSVALRLSGLKDSAVALGAAFLAVKKGAV
jgi:glucokinase